MKSESRSEHARNEKKSTGGRTTSEHKDDKKMSKDGTHRGENAKTESRDSHGQFTSKHSNKK